MPFDPLNLHRFSGGLLGRNPVIRSLPAAAFAMALAFAAAEPAAARGPENIADVAEQVIDAVVNISTSQKIDPPDGEMIAVLTPTTSPLRLNNGPPELPRLIAASVWM